MKARHTRGCPTRRGGKGFSLLELMIALTIGLFLLGTLLGSVFTASSTARTRDRAVDVQMNGRYALDLMKRDVQHAGFPGLTSLFDPEIANTLSVTNVCDPATVGRISARIWGADDANPFSGSCIPDGTYSAGDVLVIRRLSASPVAAPFAGDRIYYRSAYEGGAYFTGSQGAPDLSGRWPTPYSDYALEETVYYVSPYTTSPAESPRVPALYRLRLAAGPAMVPELVASGVENMQVRYGGFDATGSVQYFDAADVTAWDSISSVQISLLVRSSAAEPGYQNTQTYEIGDQGIKVNDGYRRLVFASVVQLRN